MTRKNAVRPAGAAQKIPANGSTDYRVSAPAPASHDARALGSSHTRTAADSPSPAWARYIDSRLKQFVSR